MGISELTADADETQVLRCAAKMGDNVGVVERGGVYSIVGRGRDVRHLDGPNNSVI